MDYTELLARIRAAENDEARNAIVAELSADDLAGVRDAIASQMDTHREAVNAGDVSPDALEELEALGAAGRAIRAESDTRAAQAEERAAAARAVLEENGGQEPGTEEDGDPETEPTGDPEGQPTGDPETEPGTEDEPAGDARQEERVPVTAGARPALGRVSGRGTRAPAQTNPRGQRVITAAADTGFSEGRNLTANELAQAFHNRLRAVSRAKGSGQMVHVATFASEGPRERHLSAHDPIGNTLRVEQAAGRQAIVAAGGLCAPFTPDYSVNVTGSTQRPVRGALAGFTADRGGIMFRPPLDGAATAPEASGVWTNEMDAAVDATDEADRPDPKPYALLDCPDMVTAEVEAETFQLEVANVTARFDPEMTTAQIQAAEVAHARWSENRLLRKLANASVGITWDQQLGALRDVLAMLDQVIAYKRSVERLDSSIALRMIAPAWLQNMLRVDVLRALHTSNDQYFSVPDSLIARWFADRNVNITWHLDGEAAATGTPSVVAQRYGLRLTNGQPVPSFPAQLEALLFVEGEWLHLDGGELDLGVVRDSDLIGKNRYRMFREEWLGVAFRGHESLRIVADLVPNGASAGTVEPAIAAVSG